MELSALEKRLLWLGTATVGLVHLLVPGVLLRTARWGYRRLLAVAFDPKPGAKRRVRLVGLAFLSLAVFLRRYLHR
jgi:hypothetical protein